MLKVNLLAPMILTRYLAPAMVQTDKGGHILNVSSIYGRDPVPSYDAYAATKHGLSGWTMSTYAVRGPHCSMSTCTAHLERLCAMCMHAASYPTRSWQHAGNIPHAPSAAQASCWWACARSRLACAVHQFMGALESAVLTHAYTMS